MKNKREQFMEVRFRIKKVQVCLVKTNVMTWKMIFYGGNTGYVTLTVVDTDVFVE